MVAGVELVGKGIDILRLGGTGTNLEAYACSPPLREFPSAPCAVYG